jgi:hypothetical protein
MRGVASSDACPFSFSYNWRKTNPGDNAPKNGRSEAQLLVVKIPPPPFRLQVKETPQSKTMGLKSFWDAMEGRAALRLRAQIRGPVAA